MASFLVTADRPPIGLAFAGFVRDASGREWPMASDPLVCEKGEKRDWRFIAAWDGFDADRVEVILRPNIGAAARTVEMKQIWGGEIVFRYVPVVWEKNAQRPTTTRPSEATR
jgi:hypothetical protein